MPQMAPIMWTNMFLLTLVILTLITNYIYFYKSSTKKTNNKNMMKMKVKNWLW